MSNNVTNDSEVFLNGHDEMAWQNAVADLVPTIHEVDRAATQIWFAFFPLALWRALHEADDPDELARTLLLQGKYHLKEQIDSSHAFLYGHRYWPEVKNAVAEHAEHAGSAQGAAASGNALAGQIREVAARVAAGRGVEASLLHGIMAVAFMTLQQVGVAAFKAAPGRVQIDAKHARKSPQQVLNERARDDGQGLFGFLRTTDKVWTVTFDENDEAHRFKMVNRQELASAAATDKRDWHVRDPRCTVYEGPIPVQCRSASCGTCWVGVLGGAEKLTPVDRRERTKMPEFGYIDTDDAQPLIRLSCQAQGTGAISIVIPPWNGVFGKYLRKQKEEVQSSMSKVQSQQG